MGPSGARTTGVQNFSACQSPGGEVLKIKFIVTKYSQFHHDYCV